MPFDYDLLVIGAGPGGLAASERAAQYGARVAVVEADRVGGTCVIHGCIPEKLMTYAASFSQFFDNADEYGWGKVSRRFDWCQFMKARDQDIQHLSQIHMQHLEKAGVTLLKGYAKFLDAHTIELANQKISAGKILIAVGGKAVKPNLPGAEYGITTLELLQLPQQPEHIAIIGSNHVAVKLAGIMNGLISKVTLIASSDTILPNCDRDLQQTVQTEMMQQGIKILCNQSVQRIEKVGACLNIQLSNQTEPVVVETVVFVDDRVPNLENLELEKANVQADSTGIQVDEYSCTTQENIFAVGDCTPRPHWTPVAIAAGRVFADTEFGHHPRTVSYDNIPYVVSSQPEAATVGLSETQAHEQFGNAIRCPSKRFQPLFNLMAGSKQEALLKLVIESETDQVVGAHMVGECAAEIIQMLALAINAGVTEFHFDYTIGIHPSLGEEFFTM